MITIQQTDVDLIKPDKIRPIKGIKFFIIKTVSRDIETFVWSRIIQFLPNIWGNIWEQNSSHFNDNNYTN